MDFGGLYATNCAACHGIDGKLGPAPPLNDPIFLAIVSDDELLRVITNGRAVSPAQKTPMPAFLRSQGGPLTTEQVAVLAHGIKQRWPALKPAPSSLPPYRAAATAGGGQKSVGAGVFGRACAGCHGSEGQGGKNREREIGALHDQAFLALISDQALRRYAITGRPDLEMPAFDGHDGRGADFRPLSSTEIADLVAFLASWRDEPHTGESGTGK